VAEIKYPVGLILRIWNVAMGGGKDMLESGQMDRLSFKGSFNLPKYARLPARARPDTSSYPFSLLTLERTSILLKFQIALPPLGSHQTQDQPTYPPNPPPWPSQPAPLTSLPPAHDPHR
jgi:hypothetical protein